MQPSQQHPGLDLFHIGGDTPETVRDTDPDRPGAIRSAMTYDLASTAVGHPMVQYKTADGRRFLLTTDLYKFEGEPFKLVLHCPICSRPEEMHVLSINGDRKKIEFEPDVNFLLVAGDAERPPAFSGGRLNVERFGCTWELVTKQEVSQGDARAIVGGNLCRWRVVVENNVARDA